MSWMFNEMWLEAVSSWSPSAKANHTVSEEIWTEKTKSMSQSSYEMLDDDELKLFGWTTFYIRGGNHHILRITAIEIQEAIVTL